MAFLSSRKIYPEIQSTKASFEIMKWSLHNQMLKKNQLGKMLERQISIKSDLTFYWSGFYCKINGSSKVAEL